MSDTNEAGTAHPNKNDSDVKLIEDCDTNDKKESRTDGNSDAPKRRKRGKERSSKNFSVQIILFARTLPTNIPGNWQSFAASQTAPGWIMLLPNHSKAAGLLPNTGIFNRFQEILYEGKIDKRVQFLIEGLFAVRKAEFKGFPAIRLELDIVDIYEQFTHEVSLDDEINSEPILDIFKPNPRFLVDEKIYSVKMDFLGLESSEDESGYDEEDYYYGIDAEFDEMEAKKLRIKDETETNPVNLHRTIYLTLMSSIDFEEAGHKLLKIQLAPDEEMELCIMLLECCSQERTYLRYYGLLAQRFCLINKVYQENFDKCFVQLYSTTHRQETIKLRNLAKFFAHLLGIDALPWHVLAYIRLTEENTTSSSRIFIKILFQDLSEHLGIHLLDERLADSTIQDSFESIFPKDSPRNTRFAINFFTSIGLGGITGNLREYLKTMPRHIMPQQNSALSNDESGTSGSDSDATKIGSKSASGSDPS